MKSKYKSKALADLSAIGFNLSFLIENYPQQLKRIRLLSDMGESTITLRTPEEHEHPLQVAAQHVLRRACKLPIVQEYFGIPFHPTPSAYRYLINQESQALRHLPHAYITDELADYAVSVSFRNVSWLLPEMKTRERCELAIKQSIYAIECIPKEFITHEVAMAAVKKDGHLIEHVPEELMDKEIILEAIKGSRYALESIPEHLLFREAYEAMVSHHSDTLKKIPNSKIDYPLCLLAMKCSGEALYSVPQEFQTPELLESAVISFPECIAGIKKNLRTEKLNLLALSIDSHVIRYFTQYEAEKILNIMSKQKVSKSVNEIPSL